MDVWKHREVKCQSWMGNEILDEKMKMQKHSWKENVNVKCRDKK